MRRCVARLGHAAPYPQDHRTVEIFTARRLHWMLHHVFGEDATVLVPALDPPEYRDDDWWQDEAGVISFQNEVLKYLYCRLKY
jgi:hypothetical protein